MLRLYSFRLPRRWDTCPLARPLSRSHATYHREDRKQRVLKHSVERLESNLKWLERHKQASSYFDQESHVKLRNKLNTLAHMQKCPPNAPTEKLQQHISQQLAILDQLQPLILECSLGFRQQYLTGNNFVQYVLAMLTMHHAHLDQDMLIKAISFVNSLASVEQRDLMTNLIRALGKLPGTVDICLHHTRDLLALLHNEQGETISIELFGVSKNLIYRSIVEGIDINEVSSLLSILHMLHKAFSEDSHLSELTDLYVKELKHNIFCLDPATLINVLQFIYRRRYTDDELYTTVMESLLYKYNLMTVEEKSTLLLLLPFLKHLHLLQTPDISANVYSEECQMLNANLRREFENLVDSMPLDDMVTHCLAISLMFRQSKVIRKMLLASITPGLVNKLDAQGFLKLLSCCNTLHITSSDIEASRLLSKTAHAKLVDCNGADLLLGFKSLAQITAKRHRKYLVPLVQNVLNSKVANGPSVIECLHLYVTLNMQRLNPNVLESGFNILFPHIKGLIPEEAKKDTVEHSAGATGDHTEKVQQSDDITAPASEASRLMTMVPRTPCKHQNPNKESEVIYIEASHRVVQEIPLKGLCKLLECLTKMELPLERMIPTYMVLQTSVLSQVKYNSSVSTGALTGILRSLTECRVVLPDLANTILDRIHNCPELLDDPEAAAGILRFVEFTEQMDYSSKLSKALFEYCLAKPTTDLMEVLEYQRYKRPEFYEAYMEMLQPLSLEIPDGIGGIVERGPVIQNNHAALLRNVSLSRVPAGKRQQQLSRWLAEQPYGQGFEECVKIDNVIVDFFNPQTQMAILLLRPQDYNTYYDGVHLKSRMWLICSILRLKGIKVVVVPETTLSREPVP